MLWAANQGISTALAVPCWPKCAELEPQPCSCSPCSEQLCSGSLGDPLSLARCPEGRPGLLVLLPGFCSPSVLCQARQGRVTVPSQPGTSAPTLLWGCRKAGHGPLSPCKCSLSPGPAAGFRSFHLSVICRSPLVPHSSAESSRLLTLVLWQLWELLAGNPDLLSTVAPTSLLCNKDPFHKGDAFEGLRQLS